MIAALVLVQSRDPELDFVGKPYRDSEDIRDRLKAALQTLTGCSRELGGSSEGRNCFFRGHFKLSILQRGGDTGLAPRELWVRGNRKWSEEENQSHMTPLDDFLLPSLHTLFLTAAFSTFRSRPTSCFSVH